MSNAEPERQPYDSPTHAHPEPVPLVSDADLVNPLLTAADVMTPAPRTCAPASSAAEASLIFRDADCGVVPVTEDGRPVGVLTDRDLALAVAERMADLPATPVSELMTPDPVTVAPDANLDTVMDRFREHGVRRLLVVGSDGRLQGILSWTDLVPHLSERGVGRIVSGLVGGR